MWENRHSSIRAEIPIAPGCCRHIPQTLLNVSGTFASFEIDASEMNEPSMK